MCEVDYKKCQQRGSCSFCSCKDTDNFCCDLRASLSWADFMEIKRRTEQDASDSTAEEKEQMLSKIRKEKGGKYISYHLATVD